MSTKYLMIMDFFSGLTLFLPEVGAPGTLVPNAMWYPESLREVLLPLAFRSLKRNKQLLHVL